MNNNSSAYNVKIFMKLTERARYYKNFLANKISEVFNKIESKFFGTSVPLITKLTRGFVTL